MKKTLIISIFILLRGILYSQNIDVELQNSYVSVGQSTHQSDLLSVSVSSSPDWQHNILQIAYTFATTSHYSNQVIFEICVFRAEDFIKTKTKLVMS